VGPKSAGRPNRAMDENGITLLVDEITGRKRYSAPGRANRRAAASGICPFCKWYASDPSCDGPIIHPNDWPPIRPGNCFVVTYSADHFDDLADLPEAKLLRVIESWAEKTNEIAADKSNKSIVIFENRGRLAGATVDHPHSQIFAFPFVPQVLANPNRCECDFCRDPLPELRVYQTERVNCFVPLAGMSPFSIRVAPVRHVGALSALLAEERTELARATRVVTRMLDALFQQKMPYYMWIKQSIDRGDEHLYVEFVGLLDPRGIPIRYGAAEAATGVYFIPHSSREAARQLREWTIRQDAPLVSEGRLNRREFLT